MSCAFPSLIMTVVLVFTTVTTIYFLRHMKPNSTNHIHERTIVVRFFYRRYVLETISKVCSVDKNKHTPTHCSDFKLSQVFKSRIAVPNLMYNSASKYAHIASSIPCFIRYLWQKRDLPQHYEYQPHNDVDASNIYVFCCLKHGIAVATFSDFLGRDDFNMRNTRFTLRDRSDCRPDAVLQRSLLTFQESNRSFSFLKLLVQIGQLRFKFFVEQVMEIVSCVAHDARV